MGKVQTTKIMSTSSSLPWLEKYRPKSLDQVVGNGFIVERLKFFAQNGGLPHLILTGPPGVGKTTSIHAYAHQVLGAKAKDAILEMNASDERSINDVRTTIKDFAARKVELPPNAYKIIILDEVDAMGQLAQAALRRLMENYAKSTRFVLACNDSTKIIEPIQSRCAIFRLTTLKEEDIIKRLSFIAKEEKVVFEGENEALKALAETANGDMRIAINNLQSTFAAFGIVSKHNIYELCEKPKPEKIVAIFEAIIKKKNLNEALKLTNDMIADGYCIDEIVSTMFQVAQSSNVLEPRLKLTYAKEIMELNKNVNDCISSPLQLQGTIAKLFLLSANPQAK